MTTQKGLPARATDDVIAEVQRRLDTFHSPSFDREIVEQLLALARRSALASLTTGEGGGEAMVEIGARAICEADDCAWNSTEAAKASYRKQARACLNAALSPAPAGEVIAGLCPLCAGTGSSVRAQDGRSIACSRCRGTGAVVVSAPAGEVGWRTMESAPKDGTHILVCQGPYSQHWTFNQEPPIVVHYWGNPGEEGFYPSWGIIEGSYNDNPVQFTHWMPLHSPALKATSAGAA